MRFLPLFVDLSSGLVAVVGTGPDAQNKLRLLRTAGANVRWFTGGADVTAELVLLSNPPGRLEVSSSDPLQADFSEFVAVVSAGGAALDDAIAECARRSNALVNVVDRPEISNFIVPAIIDRGEVVVAIGTGDPFRPLFYEGPSPIPDGCQFIHIDVDTYAMGKDYAISQAIYADPGRGAQDLHDALDRVFTSGQRAEAQSRRVRITERTAEARAKAEAQMQAE